MSKIEFALFHDVDCPGLFGSKCSCAFAKNAESLNSLLSDNESLRAKNEELLALLKQLQLINDTAIGEGSGAWTHKSDEESRIEKALRGE